MSTNVIQPSFAAGELSPTLFARVDLAKYHTGAALLRNFFVDYRGGASTRSGTQFVARAGLSTAAVRLIPFQFSTIQNYVLEFGQQYMRVFKDGAAVLETAKTITAITNANPGVVTSAAHGFTNGQTVYLLVAGMPFLNQYTALVAGATANTFTLTDLFGAAINTTALGTFTSGTAARVYTVTTNFLAVDLALVKFTQSADVMTLTHPNYIPQNLTRTGHAAWSFTNVTTGTSQVAPTGAGGSPSSAGTAGYAYVVTAIGTTGPESVASNPASITLAVNIAVTAGTITVTWNAASGALFYNIYRAPINATAAVPAGANYGYIGNTTGLSFADSNIIPDFSKTPPLHQDPFASANNPGTVAYFQQRRMYAASTLSPETLWGSKPGEFTNFDTSNPSQADDAISATLIARQVNNIKHMIAMPGGLVVLSGGGAWQVSGGSQDSPITPFTISATPQAYNGCNDVPPITINQDILYVQSKGSIVRDLTYSFVNNIYTGIDLSVLSNHLFSGHEITEWAYAEEPFKIIWAVREDGQLLGLTYLKEQEIYGWSHHDTYGLFKSVCSIQEGTEDVIYVVVKRFIQGQWVQYIERMATRTFPNGIEDAWFLDSALSYPLTYPAAGLSVSAASGAGVVFTADSAVFASGDVGKILRVGGGNATITGFTSSTILVGTITRTISNTLTNAEGSTIVVPAVAGDWSLTAPVTTVSGLAHLQGQTVSILADGVALATQVVSAAGAVTLATPASKVVVGLSYTCRLQTLRLDTGEPSIQGKRAKIAAMTIRVDNTKGLKYGTTFSTLKDVRETGTGLNSTDERVIMDPLWTANPQMCFQQIKPYPATILGVIPEVVIGDKG